MSRSALGPDGAPDGEMRWAMQLEDLIKCENIIDLEGTSRDEVLLEMVRTAGKNAEVLDETALYTAILDREEEYTTGIGLGIAVPHARIDAVQGKVVVVGRSSAPIDFKALDDQGVSLFVLIAVSSHMHKDYIRILARWAQILKKDSVREAILAAGGAGDIYGILEKHFAP